MDDYCLRIGTTLLDDCCYLLNLIGGDIFQIHWVLSKCWFTAGFRGTPCGTHKSGWFCQQAEQTNWRFVGEAASVVIEFVTDKHARKRIAFWHKKYTYVTIQPIMYLHKRLQQSWAGDQGAG